MTTFKRSNIIGFSGAFLLIAGSILFFYLGKLDSKMMYFLCSVAIIIAGMPLFFNFLLESRGDKNKEQMFLEFSRDLVEGVRSGTPISKSIINTKNKDYGSLSPFIVKLANQIALGITVREALDIFSREVKNDIISRAIGLIKEADRSGGRIEGSLNLLLFL